MAASDVPENIGLPESASLVEPEYTSGARWLRPSEWPTEADPYFQPRPFDSRTTPAIISRYDDVLAVMLDPEGIWRREIPPALFPLDDRHCIMGASWMLDGEIHKRLRRTLRQINRGSTDEARRFTRTLTKKLLARLMNEPPPWNLSRVIDDVSMRVIIECTLQAPPLLVHAVRLRQLWHEAGAASDGYFGMARQPEFEAILQLVTEEHHDLPDGLARHLVDVRDSGAMTDSQLMSQLGMLVVSYETQAASAASLIGMLLEHDLYGYARQAVAHPELMRRIVAEGSRRGLSFPTNLMTPSRPVTIDGQKLPAGEPVLVSYAAANMDPIRFGVSASRFDPRPSRPTHLAFGLGPHRCQGEVGAEQFVEDVLVAMLAQLPDDVQLDHDGQVLRETAGISWTIPRLLVSPRPAS
ncbi:cytochrome P450 [Micromonospora fulviviridis]|uniref:cytochrome P450 n=1 Tax=Micromonospora fulviviridis TaxID=47860 RepID=UPI0037BA8EF5